MVILYTSPSHLLDRWANFTFLRASFNPERKGKASPERSAHKICTSHAIHLWYVHNYSHYSRKCIYVYIYMYVYNMYM